MIAVQHFKSEIKRITQVPCELDVVTRNYILNDLAYIRDSANSIECEHIDSFIEIIKSNETFSESAVDQLGTHKKCLFSALSRCCTHYNECYSTIFDLINESNDENNAENDDDPISVKNIERNLDKTTSPYNAFSSSKPMKSVSWVKSRNTFYVRRNSLQTSAAKLDAACKKVYDEGKPEDFIEEDDLLAKTYFEHYDKHFVCYWIEHEPYFDLRHIIASLDMTKESAAKKYEEFVSESEHTLWTKNEYGGYNERDIVNEQTLYSIILSSRSVFANKFKSDISKILAVLRGNGYISLTKEGVELAVNGVAINTGVVLPVGIPTLMTRPDHSLFTQTVSREIVPYRLSNPADLQFALQLIAEGANIPIAKYNNKHVLYGFILALPSITDTIIIKFGYTENIVNRFISLRSEYGCEIFLVCIKLVRGESAEQAFHNVLKAQYNPLIQKYSKKGKDKIELYKLNINLTESFKDFNGIDEESLEVPRRLTAEIKTVINDLTAQHARFYDYFRSARIIPVGVDQNKYLDFLANKDALFFGSISDQAKASTANAGIEIAKINAETEQKRIQADTDIKAKQIEADTDIKAKQIEADTERSKINAEIEMKRLKEERMNRQIALDERRFALEERRFALEESSQCKKPQKTK